MSTAMAVVRVMMTGGVMLARHCEEMWSVQRNVSSYRSTRPRERRCWRDGCATCAQDQRQPQKETPDPLHLL
jgi:hypothetical protein